jgi:hypothetical protein
VGLDSTNILRGRRRTRPVASDPDDNAPTVRVEWYVWGVDRVRHGHVRTGVAAPAVVGGVACFVRGEVPKDRIPGDGWGVVVPTEGRLWPIAPTSCRSSPRVGWDGLTGWGVR